MSETPRGSESSGGERTGRDAGGRRVLRDHVRLGKRLVPPLLAAMGEFRDVGWVRTLVPEFLWLALLFDRLGLHAAVDLGSGLVKAAGSALPDSKLMFIRVSDYASVRSEEWQEIAESLGNAKVLPLRRALWPLVGLYPDCPFGPMYDDAWHSSNRCDPDTEVPYLRRLVGSVLSNRSTEALQLQAAAVYLAAQSGKLLFMEGTEPGDLNAMLSDPDSPESQRTAAQLRATLNMLGSDAIPPAVDWANHFWQQGLRISLCEPSGVEPDQGGEGADWETLQEMGSRFAASIVEELSTLWRQQVVSICTSGVRRAEVLGALLSRQVSLACTLATEPGVWAVDVGYILLRCMAETHIVTAWLSRFGQSADFERFVEYGLGQEKLLLEHLRSLAPEGAPEELSETLHAFEEMLSQERYPHLLTVDLGQFLPKTVREMADECDCHHIFALKFQPYSGNIHGTWNVLRRYHLVRCANPLHGGHRVPHFRYRLADPWVAGSAVRLVDETFAFWAREMGLNVQGLASSRMYLRELRCDDSGPETESPSAV